MSPPIPATGPAVQNQAAPPPANDLAADLVARNRHNGVVDLVGVARDLLQVSAQDPAAANVLAADVGARLDIADRGGLSREIQTQATALSENAGSDEGIGSFFEGAILGDFGDNSSWSATGGQIVGGLIPIAGQIADARDTAAAIGQVWNGEEGGWLNLGAAAIGWVPGIGDGIKAGIRGTDRAIGAGTEVAQAAIRGNDDVIAQVVRNSDDLAASVTRQADDVAAGGARQIDEVAQAGARLDGTTLVLDANVGQTRVIDGQTYRIGDETPIRTDADGDRFVTRSDGTEAKVRSPATFDERIANADGSVTYKKNGESVTYDTNGFPMFAAKVDIHLEPQHLNTGNSADHFRYANNAVGEQLRQNPAIADTLGLNDSQVAFLTREMPSGKSPPDLTWHHHQDTGRMQLVVRSEHNHFPGAHTGGMSIWGGGH
ncbi:MAG: HNH endonuclease [Pacificimonas sp.]